MRDHRLMLRLRHEDHICSIAAAIIGAASTIGGAAISSHAASSAANTAKDTNAANQAAIDARYQDTRALELPTITTGQTANSQIADLLGIGGDPAKATAAFNTFKDSAGYNFQLNSGVNAITTSKAASGSLDSGGTLKALDAYGQGLGANYFGSYLSSLGSVADRGTTATNGLTGAGTAATNATVASNTAAGNTAANATLAGAGQVNGLLSNLASIYGAYKGQSSYGGGASSIYNLGTGNG